MESTSRMTVLITEPSITDHIGFVQQFLEGIGSLAVIQIANVVGITYGSPFSIITDIEIVHQVGFSPFGP